MPRRPLRTVGLAALLALAAVARAGATPDAHPLCAQHDAVACARPPYVLVLGAMPAEVTPLLARMTVTSRVLDGTRTWWVGTMGDVPVVVGRTGIAFGNAVAAARAALARFDVWAVVFSGVSGGRLDIGDVAVPASWRDGEAVYAADAGWLAAAAAAAPALTACTPAPPGPVTCLGRTPRIVVGGTGRSDDPFGGTAVACTADGGPVSGCDDAVGARAAAGADDAVDMETAAVAGVASAAGIPFLGVRALSDGSGDPLGLPGFPAQFFAWYGLAAENAATVTAEIVAARRDVRPRTARRARRTVPAGAGAACDWERAAGPSCGDARASGPATRAVAAACRTAATGGDASAAWRRAARRVAHGALAGATPGCRRALRILLASHD